MLASMSATLNQLVSLNLLKIKEYKNFESEAKMADKAGVSANTLRNMLRPESRAPNHRGESSPRLDVLEKIANSFGYKGWQLMLGDFDPNDPPYERPITKREAVLYSEIVDRYSALPKLNLSLIHI